MKADMPMGSAPGSSTSPHPPSRRVVDAPTRAFHWLFALCFVGAYLTADSESWRLMHVTLGYTLAGLLVFRVLVVPLALSGYATFNDWGDFLGGDWVEEVHELAGNTTLTVVLAHLALIAGLSVLRKKNVALPMITGRLPGQGPDLARRNHTWLAALLLIGVLAYWTWEWQHAPNEGMMKDTTALEHPNAHFAG